MAMTKRMLEEIMDAVADDPEYIEWQRQQDVQAMMHMEEDYGSYADGDMRDFNRLVAEIQELN